jgi:hypothetical protein
MKIMVWNIERFTITKLQNYTYTPVAILGKRKKPYDFPAANRLNYMQQVFSASGNAGSTPDVIAVLEAMCDDNTAMGQPMTQNKSDGVLNLLAQIKAWTGNANWRVVPPLKCNPARPVHHVGKWPAQEVVAVYYNSTTVTFQGPDTRPAAVAPFYPPPWDQAAITNGTNRSGRVNHVDVHGAAVNFPNVGNRSPFMVDFREIGGATRLIRCLFIHTSPGYHIAGTQAVADIAAMNPPPLPAPPGTPDYYIACGDFNVNDWYIAWSTTGYNPYAPLQALNYQKQLGTANQSTHFHRKGSGPHGPAQPGPNPLGYMQQDVIDNFLVRKNTGVIPAYVNNVINCVEGSPVPWGHAMGMALAAINAIVAGPGVPGPITTFREWQNFWCIVATSDHAPIYLEIP